MPIYEFCCQECGKKSSFLLLSINSALKPRCQHCGSHKLVRLISRIAVLRSEESRLESLANSSMLSGLDENDPKSLARWMKKFGREMGEELGPDFNEEVDRAVEEAEKGLVAEEKESDDEPFISGSSSGHSDNNDNDLNLSE